MSVSSLTETERWMKEKKMAVRFDPSVKLQLQVHRTISAREDDRTVVIPLQQLVDDHSGSFLSIQKLRVKAKSNACLCWSAEYKGQPLVPSMSSGECTGITSMYEYDALERMSETLEKNVQAYSFSVLKTLYDDAKADLQRPRKKGAPYEVRTYYLDASRQEGGVECILLSQNSYCDYLLDEKSGDSLLDLIKYLLENHSTSKLFEYYSETQYELLFKYGVELDSPAGKKTFPMTVQLRKSTNSAPESMWILPLESLRKVGRYLEEIDRNSNLVYVLENKQEERPTVNIQVPSKLKTEVVIEMEFLSALRLSDQESAGSAENNDLGDIFGDLNPKVMANYYELKTTDTEEQLEHVVLRRWLD